MSRKKRNHQTGVPASRAWARARQTAAQVKPLARSTGEAAKRRVHTTRAWAAPQVKHAGQVLEDRVAPKASALLSSAARRIEPAKPRHWRKLAGISMLTAAASSVVAALARNRRKPDVNAPAAEAEAKDVTSTPQTHDGPATTPTGAKAR